MMKGSRISIFMYISVLIVLCSYTVHAGLISAGVQCVDSQGNPCFDPTKDDWYKVEDWELDVCRMWGGPENIIEGMSTYGNFISQLTATLQSEKEEITDNITVYKYSFFVMPMKGGEEVTFDINFRDAVNGSTYNIVEKERADASSGAGGYEALVLEENFDVIELVMKPGGVLTVPVMQENYELGCEGCGFTPDTPEPSPSVDAADSNDSTNNDADGTDSESEGNSNDGEEDSF